MKTRLLALSACCIVPLLSAATVTPDELAQAHRWVNAKFGPTKSTEPSEPGLYVLANHDPVFKNSRGGKPLQIGERQYTRGLYCHAFSKIIVRLPGPAHKFSAVVGVDSNEQTSGGRGSVDFSVSVAGVERFRSGVMREGMAAKTVQLDLGGAREFTLEIDPTPDGIACDQADWADARVKLSDGREIWLADLPLRDQTVDKFFSARPPFSFMYRGQTSTKLLSRWPLQRNTQPLDDYRIEHQLTWTDPESHLTVRCSAIGYRDFPIVEWTLYFKNNGTADTAIIENIQALDCELTRSEAGEFLLHHNIGSPADGNDYGPLETRLKPGATKRIGGAGGRPTNSDWSYFNLETRDREGLILAVGWPGQWAAEFVRDTAHGLHIRAGQELTHFKLLPQEDVRSPLIVLQFWKGDWLRAQNIWRRWMKAHSMPKPGGNLPPPQFVASSSRQYDEMIKANETNQIMFIERYAAEGLKLDYWWMDAGWYQHHGGGWPRVGTWLVDSNRFPHGLRVVADYAHKSGVKILVWFEPERVAAGTWLATNHPEWILGGGKGGLLNLGNDDARHWLIEHVDRILSEQGIDLYRQDFNMDPLPLWRANDAADRQGITEIKHVTGYLAYWDELRRRHPNMLIDSCASGGRRNDVETMRRAVPLWRSDYAYEAIGHQCMTYGASLWLPYHGTGTVAARNANYYGSGKTPVEPYAFWSNASQLSLGSGIDMRVRDLDYAALRRLVNGWRTVAANYYGDFYPLTAWSRDNTLWMAWQFDAPEAGTGVVQAFRREKSPYESARFKLHGLEPAARYHFETIEGAAASIDASGAELMEHGISINLVDTLSTAVLSYRKR